MNIKYLHLLFLAFLTIPVKGQTVQEEPTEPRTISSFREYRSKIGTSHTIGDLTSTISTMVTAHTEPSDLRCNQMRHQLK